MKKVMIALALFIGLNAAQAQKRGNFNKDPEARAKARVEHLDKELNLTTAQKESIHTLVLDQAKSLQSVFKDSDRKQDNVRGKVKEMNAQTDVKIAALLDASQKQKFAELQKNRPNRRPEGGKREVGKREGRTRS
ncbi:hypothetical protein M8998_10875 [Sphingobacterium sp. lm-10]|uniref:hypothetical protein n=1 Tax=Sphingobacterium sp. lm-10 TaxID=2944904 RepID=UPI0020209EC1|nr:hypothetical protein [Sphingobacterium sp. lm-10]MCL7988443.1 hypothetical protein [Sphingobacterium sp. lm-10]